MMIYVLANFMAPLENQGATQSGILPPKLIMCP